MRTFLNMGLVKASNEKTRQPAAPLIAQAPRPAAGQKIASVPTPKRVPRPPEKSVAAVAASRGNAARRAGRNAAAASANITRPAVEIARVRSVLVGPRSTAP